MAAGPTINWAKRFSISDNKIIIIIIIIINYYRIYIIIIIIIINTIIIIIISIIIYVWVYELLLAFSSPKAPNGLHKLIPKYCVVEFQFHYK